MSRFSLAVRTIAFWLALLLGTSLLMAGAILATASRSLFSAEAFGQRAADSLSDPGVAAFVADRLTDTVVDRSPDFVAARPLILATADALVTSRPFQSLVAGTARRAHEALLSEASRNVVLSLPDVEVLVRAAIQQASPELAAKIPSGLELMLTSVGDGVMTRGMLVASRISRQIRWEASTALLAAPIFLGIHDPNEFSCRPNGGGTDSSLFLLNHWIETTPARGRPMRPS